MSTKKAIFLAVLQSLVSLSVWSATPAFPGAEGWGRYTTGGRGGSVYYVTSLEDNADTPAAGTFRWAVNQPDSRIILFNVSGTIHLKNTLNITSGNLTIAGQSAPGDGICLADFPLNVSASNVIIRFLRVRMGDLIMTDADGADALGGRSQKNVIIDHCSCSWSTDECVSFYGNENFTLQWCFISESLKISKHTKGAHGYGGIWGGAKASFHHNLLIHHSSRTPRLGSLSTTVGREVCDLRNNVIYNHGGFACYGAEGMNGNIVNCYYKPGPSSQTDKRRGQIINIGLNSTDPLRPRWGQWYVAGNFTNSTNTNTPTNPYEVNSNSDNWKYGVLPFVNMDSISAADLLKLKAASSFDPGEVTTHSPQEAYKKVLAWGGCSLSRDTIDGRLVYETRTGKTTFTESRTTSPSPGYIDTPTDTKPAGADSSWTPWPVLQSRTPLADLDLDGLPDHWEDSLGLNKRYRLDARNVNPKTGYTYVEDYLNSLVQNIMVSENLDASYTTAVNEVKMRNEGVRVVVSGDMTVYCDKGLHELELFDMSGRKAMAVKASGQTWVLPNGSVKHGFYLLKVTDILNQTETRKLIL
jgi:hypothetical protein